MNVVMTLYDLKPRFQAAVRPLAAHLARRGVTANQVTIAAAVSSIAVAALVAVFAEHRPVFLAIPVWLGLRMALNAIDGILAREFGQESTLGAYLNELCDVVSDAALYLPFALVAPFDPAWVGAVILASVVSEFAGVLGPMVGASRRYDGPLGKSDRALLFGALGLIVASTATLPPWLFWLMPLAVLLLCATAINRVRHGLREAGESRA